MLRFSVILFLLVAGAVVGGSLFLANADIAPPAQEIEKVLPDDRFPR